MRQISTRTLRAELSTQLDDMPFEITKNGHVIGVMCTQEDYNTSHYHDFEHNTKKSSACNDTQKAATHSDVLRYNSTNRKLIKKWCPKHYSDKYDEVIKQYVDLSDLVERIKNTGCIACEYKKLHASLCFHHIKEKTETIAVLRRSNPLCIIKEIVLYPMLLLCANCHAEVHANLIDISKLDRVNIDLFVPEEIKELAMSYKHTKIKRTKPTSNVGGRHTLRGKHPNPYVQHFSPQRKGKP